MEYRGKSKDVSWIRLDDHFNADELDQKGIRLVESDNANKYHWMAIEVIRTHSTLKTIVVITNVDIMVDNPSDWLVLLVNPAERMCNSFEGCLVPLYEFILTMLGVRLPFFDFEVVVMNLLRVTPSQLYPKACLT